MYANSMLIRSVRRIRTIAAAIFLLASAAAAAAVQQQHDSTATNTRGAHVMGFDQSKTTHHFTLTKTGGIIQVQANDPSDDFTDPHEDHAETPPGVPEMKSRKDKISYQYESIAKGAKVIITTQDPKALEAVHDYLRYQIREHKTGDPLDLQ
jgi:opacity protein-like surface antigen